MDIPSPSVEKKLVLPPARASALIRKMRGEKDGEQLSADDILQFFVDNGGTLTATDADLEGVEEMEFPTGPEAKKAKLEAGKAGNIFVQRGIVLASGNVTDRLRIALHQRNPGHHQVTTGGSIIVSGDVRKNPADAVTRKVAVNPALADDDFEKLGLSLSDPRQTGGIPYLFVITRGRLTEAMAVSAKTDDVIRMVTADEAEAAIAGKAMELKVLERLRMGS